MKNYFKNLLRKYYSFYLLPGASVLTLDSENLSVPSSVESPPDYILLNGAVHYSSDVQGLLEQLHSISSPRTRLVISYYNNLWRPAIQLATRLGLRKKQPDENWIAPSDMLNLLHLSQFELIHHGHRILMPVPIPILSNFINRWIAPLPFFNWFSVVNIAIAKPISKTLEKLPTVSVVVAARNEAGNIPALFSRLPQMGGGTELIIIEGGSSDDTWNEILKWKSTYAGKFECKVAKQDGKGKGDAVRKGFAMAQNDILMILDADLTVPPEDLPKFYQAIANGKGDFINGSRLVYPLESEAMRFFNIIGNKFFALAFSFLLGQSFKDTLCGTKVLYRKDYEKIAKNRSYFGEFDPFGDFDLLFGAARTGLKIIELPIRYRNRTYGETNIQRWRHGVILLRMVIFAARKIKFI